MIESKRRICQSPWRDMEFELGSGAAIHFCCLAGANGLVRAVSARRVT